MKSTATGFWGEFVDPMRSAYKAYKIDEMAVTTHSGRPVHQRSSVSFLRERSFTRFLYRG